MKDNCEFTDALPKKHKVVGKVSFAELGLGMPRKNVVAAISGGLGSSDVRRLTSFKYCNSNHLNYLIIKVQRRNWESLLGTSETREKDRENGKTVNKKRKNLECAKRYLTVSFDEEKNTSEVICPALHGTGKSP